MMGEDKTKEQLKMEMRKLGINILGNAPWGTHICQFYHTKEDLLEILVPYFKAGLENNEFCMWITSEPLGVADIKKAMNKVLPGFDRYLSQGQMEVIPYTEWYLRDGIFDAHRVLKGWVDKLTLALERGYDGLRLTGNTFWLEKKDWRGFTDYEEDVDGMIGKYKIMAICTYCLDHCGPSEVIDVFKNHQITLIRNEGGWERIDNPKRLAEELRKWSHIFEHAELGIVIGSADGKRLEMMNPAFARMHGYAVEELTGRPIEDVFAPECREELQKQIRTIHEKGHHVFESRHIRKDGTTFPVQVDATTVKDEKGKVLYRAVYAQDITERKSAEEKLRKSEAGLASAQRIAHIGSWEWDVVKDELYWSDEVYRIFGLAPHEFGATYDAFLDSVHPDDRDFVKRYVSEALYKKKSYGIDHRIVLPDGTERIVHEQAEVFFDETGRSIRVIGTVQDITENKKVEEEIQRNYHIQTVVNALQSISLKNISLEEQLDMIIDRIVSIFWLTVEPKAGIFLVDKSNGLVLKAHRGFSEEQKSLCGSVPSGRCLCGRALLSGSIEFADRIDDRHENLYEGMTPHGHYCVPIMSDEKILGVLVLYLKEGHRRDVSEEEFLKTIANIMAGIIQRKRAEEELDKMEAQLLQSQKMEAIGQLAGGVAHDFNNLMTVVQGNTDLALMKIGEDEPVYRNIKEIGRVTAKAAALTRQLLTFSRRQPVSKEILNINKAVLEMSKMLQRLIGENISLSTELSPDLWNMEADPGQIEQLLMNLVVNAKDTMPNGGKLRIKTENARIDETYRQIYGEGRPGRFVEISVEDTGTGMDAETRARIFEPFFTTKGIGKGTGLGLSVVYGIVKGHDGWINVYSEPGSGSNFRIYLPAASGDIEEKGDKPRASEIRGGNERILLVEDEADVRELALLMLEKHGYRVFVASTFDEAVSIFKEEGSRLDLLFSDMILTDRSGLELAEELRRHRPDLKVLFASGYSGEHFQLQAGHKDNYGFLEKPYTLTDLLSAVREVLDENRNYRLKA